MMMHETVSLIAVSDGFYGEEEHESYSVPRCKGQLLLMRLSSRKLACQPILRFCYRRLRVGTYAPLSDEHEGEDSHEEHSMELVFGCYVEAQGSHHEDEHEDEHDEEHDDEHGEEHESHANYAPVLADDDCAFYSRTDTSLKHAVDDSQMFGLKRSDVIGTVWSTHLTPSSPERYLNARRRFSSLMMALPLLAKIIGWVVTGP